jgi:hypothetical protein
VDRCVDRVNKQITDWLMQADPDQKLIKVNQQPYELREVGIGTYQVNGLWITIGSRLIRVEPIARNVAGPHSSTGIVHIPRAYGRIDLTDGLQRFMIFRVEKDPDHWNIIEQDSYRMHSFGQTSFEEACKRLLE